MSTRRIRDAIAALRRGELILIYDGKGREEETDLVAASQFVTKAHIRRMRRDAGGLICVAVHPKIADKLGLPFLVDVWRHARDKYPVFKELEANDIPYDEKSSFSITVNHRRTFTGITDADRALTIRELSRIAENALNGYDPREFGRNFRSPGHVVLLRAAEELLDSRMGHTELSVALLQLAGLTPVATICEMLGDQGGSLSPREAREYARRHGLVFLEGWEIKKFIKQSPGFK
jgi:3,4-dihydroxy 2-butanone 4-phosphate synthase